ncbi:uncharacterized protein LOC135713263 [Ochlerotatus camptorhynchus]|uniref:uncharacterized protein LOC135713263 n=1 Tax=Ochlerotatus camptorhynchus TaxID=644619 RepID=UPI0031E100D4
MEGNLPASPVLERDILEANNRQEERRLSTENALANARNLLLSQIGDNGDNMFTLLMRLVSRILAEKPKNAVELFEEYCRLVKQGHFIHPDYKITNVKGAENELKVDFANVVLRKIKSQEGLRPPLNIAQLAPLWAQIGFALPPSMDYFIDRQMELLRRGENVKAVRFWGTVITLTGSYYVIELERDSFEAVQLELQLSQEKAEIARDVIEGLIRMTVSDDSIISDWCGAESMAMEMIEQILEAAIPPDTDEQLATAVAIPVIDRIIEEAIDEAQEPEVELSVMGSLDVVSCSATLASSDLSLNQLKFASAKALLEVKLNVFRYYVCSDPFDGDWSELPGVNLDKIIASRGAKRFFKGNLESSVGKVTERDHLRTVLTRISMDRFGTEQHDKSNPQRRQFISDRDVTVYYKATGFAREWQTACADVKSARWLKSFTWPGSFVYGAEDSIYCGWGVEGLCL